MAKSFKKMRKEEVPATSTANIPADTVVVKSKKKKKKKKISLDALLTIPEEDVDEEVLINDDDEGSLLTVREMEDSMNPHSVHSMKDLRPDDYKGFSVNVSKLFNMIKNRKKG